MENETKQKELNRLYELYYERDKKFESAKGKRTILTILGFTAFYFYVLYSIGEPTGWDVLWALVVALVMAGFHFFINASIFLWLFRKGQEESDNLKAIKQRIDELSK